MGINQWRDEKEWPLPGTDLRRYYLHSRGRANSAAGDGALSTDAPGTTSRPIRFSTIRSIRRRPSAAACAAIRRAVRAARSISPRSRHRADVLVYSTEPLAEDLEVTGPVTLTLYASSSAPDTDFTAKLVDVSRAGSATNLTDGIIRAR